MTKKTYKQKGQWKWLRQCRISKQFNKDIGTLKSWNGVENESPMMQLEYSKEGFTSKMNQTEYIIPGLKFNVDI